METEKTPLRTFTLEDLNNDPEDYTKGRSIGNLKNNPEYINLVETSNAKTFESIEQSNAFHFKLMQEVADQL